jgi:hypothetical protein
MSLLHYNRANSHYKVRDILTYVIGYNLLACIEYFDISKQSRGSVFEHSVCYKNANYVVLVLLPRLHVHHVVITDCRNLKSKNLCLDIQVQV